VMENENCGVMCTQPITPKCDAQREKQSFFASDLPFTSLPGFRQMFL